MKAKENNVVTFKTLPNVWAAVTACVAASEQVKGQWLATAQGLFDYAKGDKAQIVAIVGDGDGNAHSKELEKAVIAGLPVLSRTLLETARADTAEDSKDARDAAQANVASYIRRIRGYVMDILEGKKPAEERSEKDNIAACAELAAKLQAKIGKLKGNFGEAQMLAGFIHSALDKAVPVGPSVIGMAAMLKATAEAK